MLVRVKILDVDGRSTGGAPNAVAGMLNVTEIESVKEHNQVRGYTQVLKVTMKSGQVFLVPMSEAAFTKLIKDQETKKE